MIGELEMELINYIFHKILMTWGEPKFWQQFSDEKTLKLTKRDWARDLMTALKIKRWGQESESEYAQRAKERIDLVFTDIRTLVDQYDNKSWEWPNLKKVSSYMANYRAHACHRPFEPERALPDLTAREKNKTAGNAHLKGLKGMFA